MNKVAVPLEKEITLEDLTAEQFRMIEKATIFDDLKNQYNRLRLNMKFNIVDEIGNWLDTVNSIHTRRMYLTAINHFLRYCNNDILNIGAKEADKYILFLKDDKCSGGTVRLYSKAVSAFYTHLERYDFIHKNPFKNSKIKVEAKPKDKYIPSEEEIEAVEYYALTNFSSETYIKLSIAIHLMKHYGVRIGFVDNIKLERDTLISFSKGKEYRVVLKTEEDVAYYTMNKEVLNVLNSNSIAKWFNDCVHALYKSGEIQDKFSPHCLRHYFAINFYKQYLGTGDVVYELMKLLGHSSMNTTIIYLRSLGLLK